MTAELCGVAARLMGFLAGLFWGWRAIRVVGVSVDGSACGKLSGRRALCEAFRRHVSSVRVLCSRHPNDSFLWKSFSLLYRQSPLLLLFSSPTKLCTKTVFSKCIFHSNLIVTSTNRLGESVGDCCVTRPGQSLLAGQLQFSPIEKNNKIPWPN